MKTIYLTESDLRNMVLESTYSIASKQKMINEGFWHKFNEWLTDIINDDDEEYYQSPRIDDYDAEVKDDKTDDTDLDDNTEDNKTLDDDNNEALDDDEIPEVPEEEPQETELTPQDYINQSKKRLGDIYTRNQGNYVSIFGTPLKPKRKRKPKPKPTDDSSIEP